LPQDPYPFNSGRIAKIRIENQNHRISVPLSERSSGFVWFFSFLAQFKHLRKKAGKTIILLDEPGLTLHGKAQSDLLRYIESRVLPDHQIIYTTHSPYMVPVQRLADVRVVEDVLDLSDPRRPVVKGTKVSADLLSADKETLFPLQAHLGYEITQSLFVGQNCLLVDGPSDLIYLQLASKALQSRGRKGLDSRWTLCPSGGLDKVAPFASLFSENHLNIAALCDFGSGDTPEIERLQESRLLKAEQVLTIADFAGKPESGVEDLFDPALYCKIVNQALGFSETSAITTEKAEAAGSGSTRIARQVEALCKQLPPESPGFNPYLPAEWLIRHPELLDGDNPAVIRSLDRFEAVFVEFNQFL
ncbi:MAG: AAA family ATPase, partial [Betaproteobacteria bacterium]|nr:AAA family ATPase [Betaproteobacteria bacterium]